MRSRKWAVRALLAAAVASSIVPLAAQGGEKYSVRLGWVPIANAKEQLLVAGKGTATATLTGTKLAITGAFEGLLAPATVARLHAGVAKAARGPAIGDLTITKGATSGTLTGSFDLNAEQLAALKQGRLYLQVHTEKGQPPDGSTLWGWLLR